jgi:lipopolysaccharide/colanic/teichoic acid biosynthesis glycosyltransferase
LKIETNRNIVFDYVGEKVYNYLSKFLDTYDNNTLIVHTTNLFNILNRSKDLNNVINLSKVNNIRFINKFFEGVNNKIQVGDYFICCTETIKSRRKRQRIRAIPILRNIFYLFEFIFLRVFPKIWGLKKIFFLVTRGRRRLLSKAEVLGRLVSCGFEVVDYCTINGILYIVTKKIKEPEFNDRASYGPLYSMPRIGKGGNTIYVYKFRTMHPFAEYLQEYIVNKNGYSSTGKPKDDFRLTPWGKFFRKYWIDEVPQLINIIKFELKFVGVRPVSKFYFESLPENIKNSRLKHKPGCIPPYVSLNRKSSVEEVIKAEVEYMDEKEKNPYTTDLKYFIKAIYNIVLKGKRSA